MKAPEISHTLSSFLDYEPIIPNFWILCGFILFAALWRLDKQCDQNQLRQGGNRYIRLSKICAAQASLYVRDFLRVQII
jgi:hypothetical protein